MSVGKVFKERNVELQYKLHEEIEKAKSGNSTRNICQLESILKELMIISNIKQLPLKYPRFIIDSWDYADDLGNELLDLATLYKRWI